MTLRYHAQASRACSTRVAPPRLASLTSAMLPRRIPAAKDLAQLNASISCDLPNDFIASDPDPNGARAALPDESKGRANAQCKGDPVEQQFEYTFSNAKGSTLQAAPTNTPVKDAKTTIRFSDNSGKDVSKERSRSSQGKVLTLISLPSRSA